MFASVEKNPENMCFCPGGPPCAPHGLFNVSACQYGEFSFSVLKPHTVQLIYLKRFVDSPVLISFPHFYMADDSLRTAVDGMSPAEKDKHQFFIDVQPVIL